MIGIVSVVLQLLLEVLRLRREHAGNLGVSKLPAEERKRIDAALVAAVKSKNTSDLERFLKGGDLPAEAAPADAPKPGASAK